MKSAPLSEHQVAELRRAYQVLGVPFSASADAIKQCYRRMAKRWHPDLYPAGTPSHDEATRMMAAINEAYSSVQHAPLRYHVESYPSVAKRKEQARSWRENSMTARRDTLPVTDRIEFWVRFICGAFWGLLMSLKLVRFDFQNPVVLIFATVVLAVGFGLAAAKYGDRFWRAILQSWWLWG